MSGKNSVILTVTTPSAEQDTDLPLIAFIKGEDSLSTAYTVHRQHQKMFKGIVSRKQITRPMRRRKVMKRITRPISNQRKVSLTKLHPPSDVEQLTLINNNARKPEIVSPNFCTRFSAGKWLSGNAAKTVASYHNSYENTSTTKALIKRNKF